jgi:hypothetical protein
MATLLITWAFLILITYTVGTSILLKFSLQSFLEPEDRIFITIWIGIVITSSVLLFISIIAPLNMFVAIGMLITSSFLLAKNLDLIIKEFNTLKSKITYGSLVACTLLTIIISAISTHTISWFDTGLYHIQSVKWLSEFGSTTGLGLIHKRLAFTSSWFAFSAPLNSGLSNDRNIVAANSYVLWIVCIQITFCIQRILQDYKSFRDYFLVSYFLIASIYIAKWKMPVSASPDLPVLVLIGITTWSILLIEENQSSKTYVSPLKNTVILPLVLSLGAVLVKLSSIPIFIISACFFFKKAKLTLYSLISLISVSAAFLVPLFAVNIKISGCPLYPSSAFCLRTPWTLPADTGIGDSWRRTVENGDVALFWIIDWMKVEKFGAILVLVSVITVIYFILSKKINLHGISYLVFLGCLGVTFIMLKSPSTRIGLGYFCVLPALLVADFYQYRSTLSSIRRWTILLISTIFLVFCSVFIMQITRPSPFYSENTHEDVSFLSRLLMPSEIIQPEVLEYEVNDLEYLTPKSGSQCWAVDIPCAPSQLDDVRLRVPELGLAGGLISDNAL